LCLRQDDTVNFSDNLQRFSQIFRHFRTISARIDAAHKKTSNMNDP